MNVLLVVTRLNIGGTEMYVLSLAHAFQKLGVRVGIATAGGPLIKRFRNRGYRVHIIKRITDSPIAAANELTNIVRTNGYQLVHTNDSESFHCIALLTNSIPTILTVHGTYHRQKPLLNAAKKARAVIAVSPILKTWLVRRGIPQNKIHVIPNGIDTAFFTPSVEKIKRRIQLKIPTDKIMIAYAGRFQPDKQSIARKILLASEKLATQHPNTVFVLVGPGKFLKQLQVAAAKANKRLNRSAILVRPPIKGMNQLYQASDIIIGTGRVALEAMACGKPVVSAGKFGTCGIITSKTLQKMVYFHYGDHGACTSLTVKRLCSDLDALIKNTSFRLSLQSFGTTTVRNRFSSLPNARKLLKIYTSIL